MKFIRVNLTTKRIDTQDVPPAYAGLGGRALTSRLINSEVPAACDPLGPENKLVFAPGYLSGTPLVNTSRLSIGAKSPLTGGIKESNVGGTAAAALANLGITALIVEGQADEGACYFLHIDGDGEAALLDAGQSKGMRTYALVAQLKEAHGDNISVTCIGPAGVFQLTAASIQTTDLDGRPCRAAGRGGLGAVMGAKGLKALVVDRSGKAAGDLADPVAFKEASKAYATAVRKDAFSGEVLPALGAQVPGRLPVTHEYNVSSHEPLIQ